MKLHVLGLLAAGMAACCAAWAERDLAAPGETVESALQEAQRAVAQRPLPIQINAVGLGVQGDANAVAYLQQMAAIGGGHYYEATGPDDVEAAMMSAATGAPSGFMGAPIITSPRNGEVVGPSTVVKGRARAGALVIVWTAVYNAKTGELMEKVPGHRHRADQNGEFALRISTPRVYLGQDVPLRYEIHAQTMDEKGNKSLEAIVTVVSPQ